MKKIITTICLISIFYTGFTQIRYDNGGITDNGTIGEYTIQGNQWNNRIITYFFQNTTFDFDQIAARASVRAAFNTWQVQARIYFIETCNAANADIVLSWGTGNHGDSYPFDGINGVLAHAYYPPPNSGLLAGDVHFDDAENWSNLLPNSGGQPIDLQTVALHELGHSLGLAHSTVTSAIMYAFYGGARRDLAQDDIDGIRFIYGSPIQFINGANAVCGSTPQTYTIAETLPAGHTLIWSTNNSQVPVSSNGIVTNNGFTGTVTLTATITNGCGQLIFTKQIEAVQGTVPSPYSFTPYITQNGNTTYMSSYCNKLTAICGPNNPLASKSENPDPNFVSPNSFCASGYITDPTVNSITWSVLQTSPGTFHGSYSFTGNQFNVSINANYQNEWIILRCTRTNSCGSAFTDYRFYANGSCFPSPTYCQLYPNHPGCMIESFTEPAGIETSKISISPNPSSGQFAVTLNTSDKLASINQIVIKDKMGRPVYQQKFNNHQKTQTINLSNKTTDIYMVEVFDGKRWTTQKLSLQH